MIAATKQIEFVEFRKRQSVSDGTSPIQSAKFRTYLGEGQLTTMSGRSIMVDLGDHCFRSEHTHTQLS